MTSTSFPSPAIAAISFALLFCLHRVVTHFYDPLRKIPGPFWGRFTRLWLLNDALMKRSHETIEKLHQKYGPVVRLAPDAYSIADLDVARQLYGIRTPFEKSDWYSTFTAPGDVTIFTNRNNRHFSQEKRKFAASYSLSGLIHYEGLFDQCLGTLCKKFEVMAVNGTHCNMAQWLRLFAYDAIGQVTFGESFGGLETGHDDHGVLKATQASAFYGTVVGVVPELHRWLWSFLPSDRSEKAAREFTQKQLQKKRDVFAPADAPTMSFVDVWLQRNERDEAKMTMKDISLGIAANLGAGSDTTSQAICTLLFLLCTHPEALKKLQQELDAATADGRSEHTIIRYEVAKELPYLQATIKESLRLYPVVGTIMPRRVPQGGATLAGYYFHEGLTVGLNPWSTRTNEKYFGADAAIFRPERWLSTEDEVKRNEYYHMPFSMGPRSCLGKNIAMLEMSKAVAQLVYQFEFSIIAPARGAMRFHNHMVVNADSFVCKIARRLPGAAV